MKIIYIGNHTLVRISDVEAKIREGRGDAAGMHSLITIAQNVTYQLRQDYEKGGAPVHNQLIVSSIAGYKAEYPDRDLFSAEDPGTGLASHFIHWLKQYPPRGGGDDGAELREWIKKLPAQP